MIHKICAGLLALAVALSNAAGDVPPVRSLDAGKGDVPVDRFQVVRFTADGRSVVCRPWLSSDIYILEGARFAETRQINVAVRGSNLACSPVSNSCVTFDDFQPPMNVVSLADGRSLHNLTCPVRVLDAVYSRDGRHLVVCGDDWKNQKIDYKPGKCVGFNCDDWSTEFSVSGEMITSSLWISRDGDKVRFCSNLKLEEYSRSTQTTRTLMEVGRGAKFAASADGNRVVILDLLGAELVDLSTGVRHRLPRRIPGEPEVKPAPHLVAEAVFIPKTELLALAYTSGDIAVWNISTYHREQYLVMDDLLFDMDAAPDGSAIAVCGGRLHGHVNVWQVKDFRKPQE